MNVMKFFHSVLESMSIELPTAKAYEFFKTKYIIIEYNPVVQTNNLSKYSKTWRIRWTWLNKHLKPLLFDKIAIMFTIHINLMDNSRCYQNTEKHWLERKNEAETKLGSTCELSKSFHFISLWRVAMFTVHFCFL